MPTRSPPRPGTSRRACRPRAMPARIGLRFSPSRRESAASLLADSSSPTLPIASAAARTIEKSVSSLSSAAPSTGSARGSRSRPTASSSPTARARRCGSVSSTARGSPKASSSRAGSSASVPIERSAGETGASRPRLRASALGMASRTCAIATKGLGSASRAFSMLSRRPARSSALSGRGSSSSEAPKTGGAKPKHRKAASRLSFVEDLIVPSPTI